MSNRYTPRDTVPSAGRKPAPTADTNVRTPRPTARVPGTTSSAPRSATPIVTAPASPRLSGPRNGSSSITSGVVARSTSRYYAPHYGNGHYGHGHYSHDYWNSCHNTIWGSYWDPWCHDAWGHGNSWSIGIGGGSFGWSLSLWQPFWYSRSHYWDHCYHNTFWNNWSNPYCAQSSYWWYPSTTYCPTYLYVPSTVIVTADEPAVASAPAAAAPGGTSDWIVVGGGVVGSARTIDVPAGTAELSTSLATKYVELGDFYFKANRFRDAAEAYGKARSYAPDDASVHFVLADAVIADGDWHYAAFLIAEGLRLDPAMAAAETDKRTFYSDLAVFEAQVAALDAYLAESPYDAQAHLVRGYNLRFAGKPTAAIVAFRRVLEIDAGNRAAATFLAALESKPAGDATVR